MSLFKFDIIKTLPSGEDIVLTKYLDVEKNIFYSKEIYDRTFDNCNFIQENIIDGEVVCAELCDMSSLTNEEVLTLPKIACDPNFCANVDIAKATCTDAASGSGVLQLNLNHPIGTGSGTYQIISTNPSLILNNSIGTYNEDNFITYSGASLQGNSNFCSLRLNIELYDIETECFIDLPQISSFDCPIC